MFINRWLLDDTRKKAENMFRAEYVGSEQALAIIQLIDNEIEHRGTIRKGWIFKRYMTTQLICFGLEIVFGWGEAVMRLAFLRWHIELRFKGKKYE